MSSKSLNNSRLDVNLIEKLDLNDNVILYNDKKPQSQPQQYEQKQYQQQKTSVQHIELSGEFDNPFERQDSNNKNNNNNNIKRVESIPMIYTSEYMNDNKENDEQNKSIISNVNKLLINFMWGIRQSLNVIIFTKKIKSLSRAYLFRSISRLSFNIIGDQSSHYDYYLDNNFIKTKEKLTILKRQRQKRQKRYIIQKYFRKLEGYFYNFFRRIIKRIYPRNRLKIVWDAFVYFILAINIFYVPIYLAWEDYSNEYEERVIKLVLNDIPGWVFLLDILLNFFTCYYEEGKLITKRRKIFVNYVKNRFFGDIIVVLPFLINQYTQIRYLNVILLLRIKNLLYRTQIFEEMIDLSPKQELIYDFMKIIMNIIFISHFVGCIYFFIAQIEMRLGITQNWVTYYNIPRNFSSEYICSIYWATITMVTIGYGDLTPQTNTEKLFVLIVSLAGCCYYAAIISQIGSILQQWQQRYQEKRKKMSVVIQYLKNRGVDSSLQYKVKKQISYAYELDQDYQHEATKVISTLSTPLQSEIRQDILIRVIKQIRFLSKNYSDVFIQHLITVLKMRECEAGEVILQKDEIGDSIYCILSGSFNLELDVQSYKQSEQSLVIETYQNLDSFGDYCFLTNKQSPARFISTTNSQIMVLQKRDFENIIKLYNKDYEFYKMQIDQIQVDSCYKYAQKNCQVCNDNQHFFFNCPYSNLKIYKDKIINQVNSQVKSERVTSTRLKQEKQKSLMLLEWVRSSTIQFLFDNEMLDNVEPIEVLMGDIDNNQNDSIEQNIEVLQPQEQNINNNHIKIQNNDNSYNESVIIEQQQQHDEQQQKNIRAQTVNYIMKKKLNVQNRESTFRQTYNMRQSTQRDNRCQSEQGKEEEEIQDKNKNEQSQQLRTQKSYSHQHKESFLQQDPYTPLLRKIQDAEEKKDKQILIISSQQQEKDKMISILPKFDKIQNYNIYYPQGNFKQISNQKNRIKYFSKQKFKQSVEAIRKLLVFRTKMENSGAFSGQSGLSRVSEKSQETNEKGSEIHFRRKMYTTSLNPYFSKQLYSISTEQQEQQSQENGQQQQQQQEFNPQQQQKQSQQQNYLSIN